MSGKEIDASAALERILVTYGFKQQKELAEHLGIHGNNVSSWLARNTIPSNVFLECALDTGADLHWLCYGEFANASLEASPSVSRGKALYDEIMSNGGKPVLRRIMDAYGFTLQKQLCDLLEISSGTVSTWIRRDYFPGDVVVACALDTDVSLQWIATGKGPQRINKDSECEAPRIPRRNLTDGHILEAGSQSIDLSFLPYVLKEPVFIFSSIKSWVVDAGVDAISNGRWLLGIDDKFDIYDISLLPGKKISVTNKSSDFICSVDEVEVAGKIILTMDYNF